MSHRTLDTRDAAFLAVDVQHGFIDVAEELPVPGGREVIPVINALLPRFRVRVASQDWHPPGHGSFASSHPGAKPFDMGELAGRPQVLWPDHCVQGSRGSELHEDLDARLFAAVFRKGMDPDADSYSAFSDNAQRNPTGLDGFLAALKVRAVFLGGLALDYCVRWSALDARRLLPALQVAVVVDACRPVAPRTGEEALIELEDAGVLLVDSSDLFSP